MDKIAKVQSGYEEEHYQKYHYGKRDYDYDDGDDYYSPKRRRKRGFIEDLLTLIRFYMETSYEFNIRKVAIPLKLHNQIKMSLIKMNMTY